ncbi:titin homolog [Hyalella azteca]|uniref:Titin homolog n=1 Tax=Hyalella azteca TaxID=294128 RepID=A0A8B7P4Z5_HYAAZ|nr:titin homolog [Hyalella azteca]
MSSASGTGGEGDASKTERRASLTRTTRSRSSSKRGNIPVRLTRSSIYNHPAIATPVEETILSAPAEVSDDILDTKDTYVSEAESPDPHETDKERSTFEVCITQPVLVLERQFVSEGEASTDTRRDLEIAETSQVFKKEDIEEEEDDVSTDSSGAVLDILNIASDIMPQKDALESQEECSSVTSNSDLDQTSAILAGTETRKALADQIDEMAGKEDKKKVLELMSLNFNSSADVEKAKELICETLAAKEKKATTRKSKKRRLELMLMELAESGDASTSKDGNSKYALLKTNPITHALKRVRKEPITSPPSMTSPTSIIVTSPAFLSLPSPSFTGLTSKSTTPSLRSLKSLTSSSGNSLIASTSSDLSLPTQSLSATAVTSIAIATSPALKRVRRGDRRSGSEKDSSEETTSLSEASEAESNKTDENSGLKKKSKVKSRKVSAAMDESANSSIGTPAESESDIAPSVEMKKIVLLPARVGRGRGRGRGKAIDLILYGNSHNEDVQTTLSSRLKSRSRPTRLSLPYITPVSEQSSISERDASPSSDDFNPDFTPRTSTSKLHEGRLVRSSENEKNVSWISRRRQARAKLDKGTSVEPIKLEDGKDLENKDLFDSSKGESSSTDMTGDELPDITQPIIAKTIAAPEFAEKTVKFNRKRVAAKQVTNSSSCDLADDQKNVVDNESEVHNEKNVTEKMKNVARKSQVKTIDVTDEAISLRGRKRKSHTSALEEDDMVCTRRSRSSTPVNVMSGTKLLETSRLARKKFASRENSIEDVPQNPIEVGKEEITHEIVEAKHENDVSLHSSEITAVGDGLVLRNSSVEAELERDLKASAAEMEESSLFDSSVKPAAVATKRKKKYFRGLKYSFSSSAERKRKQAREARKAAEAASEASSSSIVADDEPGSERTDDKSIKTEGGIDNASVDASKSYGISAQTERDSSDHIKTPVAPELSATEAKKALLASTLSDIDKNNVLAATENEVCSDPIPSDASPANSKQVTIVRRSMSVDEGTKNQVENLIQSSPSASLSVVMNSPSLALKLSPLSLLKPSAALDDSKNDETLSVSLATPFGSPQKGYSDEVSPPSTDVSARSLTINSPSVSISPNNESGYRRWSLQEPASMDSTSSATRSPVKQPTLDFLRSLSLVRTEDVKFMREEAIKKSENRPKIDLHSLTAAMNKKKKPIKLKRNNEVGRQSSSCSSEKKQDVHDAENPYTFVASPPKIVSLRSRDPIASESASENLPITAMRSTRRKACGGGRKQLDMTTPLDADKSSVETSPLKTKEGTSECATSSPFKSDANDMVKFQTNIPQGGANLDTEVRQEENNVLEESPKTFDLPTKTKCIANSDDSGTIIDRNAREATEEETTLNIKHQPSVLSRSHSSPASPRSKTDVVKEAIGEQRTNSCNESGVETPTAPPACAQITPGAAPGVEHQGSYLSDSSVSSAAATGSVILEGGVRKSRRIGKLHSTPQLPQPLAIAAPAAGDHPLNDGSQERVDVACEELREVLCKCRVQHNPLASLPGGPIYCQAIDSFDGRMLGCCNIVKKNTYLRVSGKIPFLLLCDIHRQRLRRHNCCPGCGLFCTQGVFLECRWSEGITHHYHRLCGVSSPSADGALLCPHCGSSDAPAEVLLDLKLARKPVVYLEQHQEKKASSGARMSWTSKGELSPDASLEDAGPELALGESGKVVSAGKLAPSLDRDKLEAAIISVSAGKPPNIKCTPKSLYYATKHGDLEKVLQVLSGGVDPNSRLKDHNQTGLHMAATMGNVAIAHVLVMAGAALDVTDSSLFTPLMIAVQKHHNNVVHYLVAAGAELQIKTNEGMTCLHLAAKLGNLTGCRHLLDSGRLSRHAINMQDEGGWTPLVWGSENRHIAVVKFLLERGANAQLCDVEQNTALHWAALSGCTRICAMLLDRGCSLHSMNAYRDTPLHIAARQNHRDAVVLLLARGATLDCLNSKGQTPLECALPDSEVYLQLTLNHKLRQMMHDKNHRSNTVLSSDIAAGKEQVPIPCINGVDDEPLPRNYLYIAENTEAANINIDRSITSLKWCQCTDGCNSGDCGCTQLNFRCWYDPEGRLLPDFNYLDPPMIFECNRACGCNKLSCNNRVVQHGITAHLQLFRTTNKGWGVRALKRILKGSYVCEYVGEIITDLEADQRQDDSYLFDLDNRDSETFCLDARNYGNVARFINHLCAPNLTPVKVFLDHQDLAFPRIALYASRDIEAEEELGFDYGEKFWMIKYKQFTCTCGGETCRYSASAIHATLDKYQARLLESGTALSPQRRTSSSENST